MNLRITEWLRVAGAPGDRLVQPPCSEQDHLEQAGGRVRSGFENLRGRSLHNPPGQSMPVLRLPYSKQLYGYAPMFGFFFLKS